MSVLFTVFSDCSDLLSLLRQRQAKLSSASTFVDNVVLWLLIEIAGERANRWVTKHFDDGEVTIEGLLQLGIRSQQEERVAANIKEVAMNIDLFLVENLTPNLSDRLFRFRLWANKRLFQSGLA